METLIVDRSKDGICQITLNRPQKLNAIDETMWDELQLAFQEVARSSEDRVLVLTGAGDAFCSGADLGDPAREERHQLARMHRYAEVGLALHHIGKPTIAKVNGVAVGAGMNIALGCDLVVASARARFCEIFVRRGLSIDLGGSWVLPRLVGLHRAKELAMLGEMVPAERAERIGLVNRVVPHEELDGFVADWAARLAAGPPLALDMTKRLLTNAFAMSLHEALEAEGMAQSVNTASEDTREAIAAFLDKRTPSFRGR